MPTIHFEGKQFIFPDDFTPAEIGKILSKQPVQAAPQAQNMATILHPQAIPPGVPVPTPAPVTTRADPYSPTPADWQALRETPAQWAAGTAKKLQMIQGEVDAATEGGNQEAAKALLKEHAYWTKILNQGIPFTNVLRKK